MVLRKIDVFTLPTPCISESRINMKINFFFTLLCGASKGFMKALTPQTRVKIKI